VVDAPITQTLSPLLRVAHCLPAYFSTRGQELFMGASIPYMLPKITVVEMEGQQADI
jgi:hypothetical protein